MNAGDFPLFVACLAARGSLHRALPWADEHGTTRVVGSDCRSMPPLVAAWRNLAATGPDVLIEYKEYDPRYVQIGCRLPLPVAGSEELAGVLTPEDVKARPAACNPMWFDWPSSPKDDAQIGAWWRAQESRQKGVPQPVYGGQWCAQLHPYAPHNAVVRLVREWWCWNVGDWWDGTTARAHISDGDNGNLSRSTSPATPGIQKERYTEGEEAVWGDDPSLVRTTHWLNPGAPTCAVRNHTYNDMSNERSRCLSRLARLIHLRAHSGLPRERLLGGAHPTDPPSPWWEAPTSTAVTRPFGED